MEQFSWVGVTAHEVFPNSLAKFNGVGVPFPPHREPIRQVAPCLPTSGEIKLFWSSSIFNLR